MRPGVPGRGLGTCRDGEGGEPIGDRGDGVGTVWGGGAVSGPGHDKSRILMRFSPLSLTFTNFLPNFA